jgi:Uma2 family endonuclease
VIGSEIRQDKLRKKKNHSLHVVMKKRCGFMTQNTHQHDQKYTYKDYLTWPDDERCELIDGFAVKTPSPSRWHQRVLLELSRHFANFLQDKPFEVYIAPFDVRLPHGKRNDDQIYTVVQPDLLIVSAASKLDDRGCKGAPDFIIEIVSPSNASLDYIKKSALYEKNKVKEYWIVHPTDRIVTVYKLMKNGKFGKPKMYSEEDTVKISIFTGVFEINLKEIFQESKLT